MLHELPLGMKAQLDCPAEKLWAMIEEYPALPPFGRGSMLRSNKLRGMRSLLQFKCLILQSFSILIKYEIDF